jgi:hypothetical protein
MKVLSRWFWKFLQKTTGRTAWGSRKALRRVIPCLLLPRHTPEGRELWDDTSGTLVFPEAQCGHSNHDRTTQVPCNDFKKYHKCVFKEANSLYSPYRVILKKFSTNGPIGRGVHLRTGDRGIGSWTPFKVSTFITSTKGPKHSSFQWVPGAVNPTKERP